MFNTLQQSVKLPLCTVGSTLKQSLSMHVVPIGIWLCLWVKEEKNIHGCWCCMNCLGKAIHKGSKSYFFLRIYAFGAPVPSELFWNGVVGCSVTSMPGICTVCITWNTLGFGSYPHCQSFGHKEIQAERDYQGGVWSSWKMWRFKEGVVDFWKSAVCIFAVSISTPL